jgi:hypothetical protein
MNNQGLIIFFILIITLSIFTFLMIRRVDKILEINDKCEDTRFGCCSDKLTPKLDQMGTNCIPRKNNIQQHIQKVDNLRPVNLSQSVIIN